MIIEGTVVNRVATALVELSDVYRFTAAILEGGDALILFHNTTWWTTSTTGALICLLCSKKFTLHLPCPSITSLSTFYVLYNQSIYPACPSVTIYPLCPV